MTDRQLCEFIDGLSTAAPSVEDFFRCLDKQVGSGSGISTGTIHKLRKIAVKEGFLRCSDGQRYLLEILKELKIFVFTWKN